MVDRQTRNVMVLESVLVGVGAVGILVFALSVVKSNPLMAVLLLVLFIEVIVLLGVLFVFHKLNYIMRVS